MPNAARRVRRSSGAALLGSATLALGWLGFFRQPAAAALEMNRAVVSARTPPPAGRATSAAFGRSGGVRMRFALPGERVTYPLEVTGAPASLIWQWVSVSDSLAVTLPRSLAEPLHAPDEPGFYRLALLRGGRRHVMQDVALAVLVPFASKVGTTLDGYRIGRYSSERRTARGSRPAGFVRIGPEHMELPVTDHLRISDFVSRDGQTTWPRYAALDERLLDKLELVVQEISGWGRGKRNRDSVRVTVDVHSGFRTPLYNRRVARAARDSRHQYGDAADIAIDANSDSRITASDVRLMAIAVEAVERAHPELAGGLGLYTQGGRSYVHVDARGTKVRWYD